MKITSAFIALAAIIGAGVNAQSNCQSMSVRKEVRSLSPDEWNRVSSVVRTMNNAGWLGWFAHIHNQYFNVIHGNEFFFPWHRRFIRDFESVAQQIDRNFVLPYWDELRDFANPAASEVMSAKFLGTNGQGDGCVRDGNQAGLTLNYPSNHCLRRQYNGGNRINAWYSPEFIQSVLSRATRMSQLRPGIEFSLHGAIHIAMGGDMVQNYSPNDFVFWIHHANIDRIWNVWQFMNVNQNFWSLDGVDNNGRPMGYGTPIPHYNDPAINTMRLGVNNMCYTYDNGNSITNRKRSLLERRGGTKKCIPRPQVSLPPLPPLVEGVFNNVDALPVPADTYVQATISQKLPPVVLDKWFPSFTGGAAPNVTTGGAPNVAIPKAPFVPVAIPDAPYIPGTIPNPPSSSSGSSSNGSSSGSYTGSPLPSDSSSSLYSSSVASSSAAHSAVYSEEYHAFNPVDEAKGLKYPMPNPFPMTEHFIRMHNYPVSEIHKQYLIAREFVVDMNAAGYQSPFAKGTTA
ncbi:hypothetical protein GGH93_002620 [Coemansia aciculifera]|nr:hypothetical protein GGH93_002620 [Coemansia aciculifera]